MQKYHQKTMKKNPALTGFIISVLFVIMAFGVYFLFLSKKDYYLVDNPTPEIYYFRINDDAERIITAGQYIKVDLPKGTNRIKVYDEKKSMIYDSAFTVNKVRGLLNISHQDYYINTQYYGYDLKRDSLLLALGTTMIDGKAYHGAPKLFNSLYTEDFYYNLDERYDPVIKNIQKVEARTKIFRKQDFLNYYKDYYQF